MKTVIMNVTRPFSPTQSHVQGATYTLNDELADYYISTGAARFARFQQYDARLSRRALDGEIDAVVGAEGRIAVTADRQPGSDPARVFVLSDSLGMRQFKVISVNASVSGTNVVVGAPNVYAVPGSFFRVINQTNDILNRDVEVVASTTANFTIRYPFDVTALWSGMANGVLYCQTNDTGWMNYANGILALSGKPINIVRNCGDGGDTIAQVLARIQTELAPLVRPGDIVIEMSGINDVGVSTTAVMLSGKKAIYDELLKLGVTVHAGTITQAQAAGYFASPAAALAQIAEVNGYIRGRCKSERHMRCFDGHAALGGGDYAVAGAVEATGVHYLPAGAQLVGARYVADCGADIRKGSLYRWLSSADNYVDATSKNLLTNCEFTGATGATPPTGWTFTGAGTNTLALSNHADGIGKDLSIAKTHTAANASTLAQDITTRVAAGDRLVFGTEFETVTVGESHYAQCMLEITVGGVITRYSISTHNYTYAQGGRFPTAGTRYMLEHDSSDNVGRSGVLIPAGFSKIEFKYWLQLGASGAFEAKVARPHCYKI